MEYGLIAIILCSLFLMVAWYIFFVEQQEYWLDLTRYRLYKIRDSLFDAAYEGKISFDDPAYGMTRRTLNGMIRFTYEMNLLYLLSIYIAHKLCYKRRRASDYTARLEMALDSLTPEARDLILDAFEDAHHQMLRHIVSTSPFLWPIMKPLSLLLCLTEKTKEAKNRVMCKLSVKKTWPVIDAEANYIGGFYEPANNSL